VSHPLPRYKPDPDPNWRHRVILETGETEDTMKRAPGTAGGDNHQLRGIPAIGRGVAGHIPGTRPDAIR